MPPQRYKNAAGRSVPTVTQILGNVSTGDALTHWAWNEGQCGRHHRETMQGKALNGTLIHAGCETWNSGHRDAAFDVTTLCTSLEQRGIVASGVAAFERWAGESVVRIVATECKMISEEHQFGGTCDLVAALLHCAGDGRCLIDIKTGSGIYSNHVAQLAAYSHLWHGAHPNLQLDSVGVLHIRDGKAKLHTWPLSRLGPAWATFLGALQLQRQKRALNALLKEGLR